MSVTTAAMTAGSNLKHVGMVIGGCNLVGFLASAGLETHKITDLVGVGSFVAAALSLSLRNPAIFNRMKVIPFVAERGVLGRLTQFGELNVNFGTARVLIANGIVIIWGARLSTYLFHRVLKLGEDKRLDKVGQIYSSSFLKSLTPLISVVT